jgi:alpha-glucosidase
VKPLRRACLIEQTERGVRLECDGGIVCRVSFLLPDLARVVYLRGDRPVAPRTWMVPAYASADAPWEGRDRLDESAWPECGLTRTVNGGSIVITTGGMSLTIALAPFALTWALPDGKVFARERARHATAFGKSNVRHAFARGNDDRFYGLGDKTGKLDLHGRRLRTAMLDSLGFDPERGDPLYKHWPLLITRDGATGVASGLFYDNMAAATFDLGCEHDNYYGPYRSYEARDGDLDYYIFPGPGIADVTRKFLSLTGRPALPPRWSLGFAISAMAIADSPNAQEQMEAFIAKCAAEKIPISAFHFGSGYTSLGDRRYVFTWNRDKYPDPKSLLRKFHAAHMRAVANLKPCLLDDHPRYEEAKSVGAFVLGENGGPAVSQFWDGEGAHIDFTSRAGVDWWRRGLRDHVLDTGMDAAWNDNNEFGFSNEDAVCEGFGERIPLDLARPLQPLLMTRASLDEQRRHAPLARQFTVTRAGCPGIQRYAQTWSGDNDTSWRSLKWNLRTGLQMSMSGMLNIGHDVGGFSGPAPDPELLVRWTQAGLLHPRFIMNSWKPDGVSTLPWLHPEATPAVREAIRLRYRLMPYFYSLMHAATAGEAVLRPTFVAFPEDPRCAEEGDELMVGPFLLAAPVVAPGERARRLYLPNSPVSWFDLWTEEALAPGAETILAAPLDRLPIAVPAGAILPMTDAGEDYSRLHDEPTRCLKIFPGPGAGSRRFVLFEDDGISAEVNGTRVTFDLAWTVEEITLSVTAEGDYALPYRRIRVITRQAERRRIRLNTAEGAPRLAYA